MKEFNFELTEKSDEVVLKISGSIDTTAKFPHVSTTKPLAIKFDQVALMNSYGIKLWCKWAMDHKDLPSIFLEECPFVFTKNFSSIRGFLLPNMQVRSFYVPFYNDESHETKNVLMSIEKEYMPDGSYTIPKVVDSKGIPMELDVDPRTYFQFLKKS